MVVCWGLSKTHHLLSRLCNVLVRLKEPSDVQGLSAPEVPVYGPVKRELEGPPVEASASLSVSVCIGGLGALAHRTWTRELIAIVALSIVCAVRGQGAWCGRNASSSLSQASGGQLEVERAWRVVP